MPAGKMIRSSSRKLSASPSSVSPVPPSSRHRKQRETHLLQLDAHPLVALVTHVKVALAAADVADLLVLVQVLVEEGFDLLLVDVAHLLRADGDFVAVAVSPLGGQGVDARQLRHAEVQHAQLAQLVNAEAPARVV